jgi:protein phosphatase
MRVLVISDLHGNWAALSAVVAQEHADQVFCLGDIVDYGPSPVETLRWVRANATVTVRGNHDTAVAFGTSCRASPEFRRLSEETRRLTIPMLSEDERRWVGTLPIRTSVELDGRRVELLHAAPDDPVYQYLPATDVDGWQRAVERVDADIILVGHTHLPVILPLGDKLLVNPGSVGLQRDGDPRASCAVLEDGAPSLLRVDYDTGATTSSLCSWGLPPDVEQQLVAIYQTGRFV